LLLVIGFLIPEEPSMPVENANKNDYHPDSFWYYPWGKSVTHKGVDIFAKKGTSIRSSVNGLVIYTGKIKIGGNIAVVLGPKWRVHYFAHMDTVVASPFTWVSNKEVVGTVGDSGNAKGKQPHLHYSIISLMPNFWLIDSEKQGWKKMFYLNPIEFIERD